MSCLNDISGVKVQNEFKQYLAHGITRIAKAFEVFDDDGIIKKSVYFGTIEYISSITNRWVRINFDDGDFEDFDKACVVKGLELYKKYNDLDPNPEGVVAPVAAAAAAAGVDEGTQQSPILLLATICKCVGRFVVSVVAVAVDIEADVVVCSVRSFNIAYDCRVCCNDRVRSFNVVFIASVIVSCSKFDLRIVLEMS
ncbi:hypothetical protein FRACYDRAFT_249599 [Fragilariopsis cylindrus CCMP1102]|uniref:Uncharacterized protein n=1 Tax=Fragilariopsis cylindrus CCMP1102 TaxID=635003 RepID=A0A1E7ES63_9STRA|nr:hypothetical protein FRACYDRAFT_249599 [Fragilariopsis cylindrus CCMP1102]|eukprot:OEU08699.1 hypothetical protein FRACYDRAFT_249599 [Fragilariopsis cylindrus CCMP1102]